MMNRIFEFVGMYLMMGIVAYGIYIVVGTIYAITKLYPNWIEKALDLKSRVDAKIEQPKSKIGHILNILFLWPYRITMGSYTIYSTIKEMTV